MDHDILKAAGAMIYACEGTKLRKDKRARNTYYYAIEVTNSTPKIIRIFLQFLEIVIGVDTSRVKGQLFTYQDQSSDLLESFWSKTSGISKSNLQKNDSFS